MLSFNQVTKSFFDDSFAIKDVSFDVEPGELVLITGPSGSGKTTLMRLLTKEYTPTSGQIIFEDQPIDKIKDNKIHQYRRKIGVVFQDYRLVPEMNVWENIALVLSILGKSEHEIEERVTDLLTLIQMTDKAFLFPSQLSGGEAQRVSIARALASAPSVIFADEPTGNLDKDTSLSITDLLQQINQLGTTILLATHDLSVLDALKNKRMIQLEKGRIIKDTGDKKEKTTNQKPETKEEESLKPKAKIPSQRLVVPWTKKPEKNEPESTTNITLHQKNNSITGEKKDQKIKKKEDKNPSTDKKKVFSLSGFFAKRKK